MRSILILLAALASPVLAVAAPASLVDCDQLRQGSLNAQARYIQIYQPRQDPGKTFDDAVSSCLDFITGFQVSIPTMWDGMLSAMAKQLMQRGCQAARGQFDKAVGDAMQSVNGSVGQIPGVGISTTSQAGVSVQGDNGSVMQGTASNAVDRVINILR